MECLRRPNNRAEKQAILLSVLLHVVLLNFVVITFNLKAVAYKPPLSFLGSILEKQDLIAISTQPFSAHNPSLKLRISAPQSVFSDVSGVSQKPIYSNNTQIDDKIFIKSTFLPLEDKEKEQLLFLQKMGINPETLKHTPLRLY